MKHLHSRKTTFLVVVLSLLFMLGLLLPGNGFSQQAPASTKNTVAEGKPTTIKGVILTRDGETFVMRDMSRADTTVLLSDATKIRTERKGIFRGLKPFDVTALIAGPYRRGPGQG